MTRGGKKFSLFLSSNTARVAYLACFLVSIFARSCCTGIAVEMGLLVLLDAELASCDMDGGNGMGATG
jgi:hypothetical protein